MPSFRRFIACSMIVSLAGAGMPLRTAHASIIPTERIAAEATTGTDRERIVAFLAREDVRDALVRNGVDPQAATARAATLSDAEAEDLAGRMDLLPAGADFGGIVGAAVFIFLVLLITDVLGFTKVFSFTRTVK